nr:hypothetical protein GCM10020092_050550 [Actinoplanes digitatis]
MIEWAATSLDHFGVLAYRCRAARDIDVPHAVAADPVRDDRLLRRGHNEAFHRLVLGIGGDLDVDSE